MTLPLVHERAHSQALGAGEELNLFEGHPDREFCVLVCGGVGDPSRWQVWRHETWLYQLEGDVYVSVDDMPPALLPAGSCVIVPAEARFSVTRPHGSVGLVVQNDPKGNKLT